MGKGWLCAHLHRAVDGLGGNAVLCEEGLMVKRRSRRYREKLGVVTGGDEDERALGVGDDLA